MSILQYDQYDPACDCCDDVDVEGQWWNLNNYYGISGYFCPNCYDKVRHDSQKQPINPDQYVVVYVQQQLEQTVYRELL